MVEGERKGCCGSTPTPVAHVLEDKLRLGGRRQYEVRRAVAWLSVGLCVVSAALSVGGTGSARLASRLSWAAIALGAPRLLRAMRGVLTGSYPVYRVLVILAILAVGLIGYPLVPAAAVGLSLVAEVVRRSAPSATTNPALSGSDDGVPARRRGRLSSEVA